MRWRIRGIHAPSGAWRSAIVDASGKAEAEALGAAGGLTNIEASVERSKWFKLWALLYLVAMFGAGLLHAYYRGDRNSPRDLGALVGAYVFGAAILLAISALIKARGGKLLILIAVPAFVMGLSAGMKKPMPKSANARDVLADLSDMKETGARLPEVREGTKASGLEPFISLTGRMMERMAAQTADYEKKGSAENILDTLQSANLVDPARRAASRETIRKVDELRVEHEKAVLAIMDDFLRETAALDIDPKRRADLLAGAKISHEKMVPVLRLQQALHGEYLNELSNILDLMDRADATLSDGRLTFATQREVDDYRRSLNRMNRLINVRQRRGQELQRNLPQMREHTQNQLGASLELQKLISWDPSPQSGARVKLDGRGIMIDGNLLMLAIEKSELIRLFGQPREVAGEEKVYCIWDNLGVGVVHTAGITRITNMMIALNPRMSSQWPKQVVRGRLTLMGVAVDENSTPWSLNRKLTGAKFASTDEEGKEYALVLERYKVMTTFEVDGSIDRLYISHLGRLAGKQN